MVENANSRVTALASVFSALLCFVVPELCLMAGTHHRNRRNMKQDKSSGIKAVDREREEVRESEREGKR